MIVKYKKDFLFILVLIALMLLATYIQYDANSLMIAVVFLSIGIQAGAYLLYVLFRSSKNDTR